MSKGSIKRERIDDMVRNITRSMFAQGLFDHLVKPGPVPYLSDVSTPEHRALARRVAAEATVMLKNRDHLLPLGNGESPTGRTIAVIGYAANPVGAANSTSGGGSSRGPNLPPRIVSALEGIQAQAAAHGDRVIYVEGSQVEDARLAASVADVAVTEGNAGTKNVTVTVRLSTASGKSVNVNYATANGTASAGSDYTTRTGTLVFNPGTTSVSFTVVVAGDTGAETDETFLVDLSGATNATLADSQAVVTIQDDDSLRVGDVSVVEGDDGTSAAQFTVQLLAAREGVAVGRPLYASLPKGHAFPGFIVPALKSGETTGQLGMALRQIETYAARRARERLAMLLALLEPLLLAGLTGLVGLIALSFFLPLFSLLGGISSR